MTTSTSNLAERYARIAWILNRQAYEQQIKGRKTALKQFYPCPKALQFTAALNYGRIPVTNQIMPIAGMTACKCHPSMGEPELWTLWNDVCKELRLPPGDYPELKVLE